jgi:uncharacterized protein (DUF3084 family)
MIWELDALRVLAKNQTVPGIALQDAISEIEKLRVKLKAKEVTIENQQRLMQERAEKAEAKNKRLRDALERFAKLDLTNPISDAIAWDILNARAALKAGEE